MSQNIYSVPRFLTELKGPQLTKGIFHNLWYHALYIKCEKGGEGGRKFVFPSKRYMW